MVLVVRPYDTYKRVRGNNNFTAQLIEGGSLRSPIMFYHNEVFLHKQQSNLIVKNYLIMMLIRVSSRSERML